jgi:NSS family neurotransmitter:Na+ symporter
MKRQRWGTRFAFVLAAIGSAAGLGNAWRFPYKAYENGGGAFFIPYFIALFVVGIPLLISEFAIGQGFQSSAPKSMAKISKKLEFAGWWAVLSGAIITFYYSVIMGWIFNYLLFSLNVSWGGNPEDHFFNSFLKISSGPENIGGVVLPVAIGLALTWLWVYVILRKGTASVGKTVAWTVPLPTILLVILGIRGATLEGAGSGLNYLFAPNFSALTSATTWVEAVGQIFFSLSLGFGIMIAYGSYNSKKSDINNNSMIVAFANSATSFLAAIAVFSILGYMANVQGVQVPDVVNGGIGLAFITYPQAISLLPGGVIVQAIFGVFFFVMLLTLGIDSSFSLVEAVESAFSDKFLFAKKKFLITFLIIGFLLGLFFSTNGGLYWLDIFDHYVGTYSLLLVGILESIIFAWYVGADNIRNYINSVSEIKIGKWFEYALKYVIPFLLIFVFVRGIIEEFKTPYEGYEPWALITGVSIVLLSFVVGIGLAMLKPKDQKDYLKKELLNDLESEE